MIQLQKGQSKEKI